MFYLENNRIYNSDWHLNQKNIWIYEFEKRKKYIDNDLFPNIRTDNDLKEFYDNSDKETISRFVMNTEYNMLKDIYNSLINILNKNKKIERYINLGDFLFNPSNIKISEYTSTSNYKLVLEIFSVLESNNIYTELFIGNHDKYYKHPDFYENLFDSISTVEFSNGTIISHYPYSYSKEGRHSIFFDEKGLLDNTNVKISIHGHTHSNVPNESLDKKNKDIKYINVCVESFM